MDREQRRARRAQDASIRQAELRGGVSPAACHDRALSGQMLRSSD
jgi:hypothetical protein